MITKRDSFVFYRSFYEAIISLPKDDQCLMFAAIANYGFDQVEPELTGINKAVFSLVKPQIDANIKRYIDGKKGGKHGSKGGRPRKQKEDETTEENPLGDITKNPTGDNLENPLGENEITPNVNANVYVNVNDYVNVNEKENDLNGSEKPNTSPPHEPTTIPKQQKKTKEEEFDLRRANFRNEVYQYNNEYHEDMLNSFLMYWGEKTISGHKMKWELQKTFEIRLRLRKWKENQNKFSKPEEQRSLRAELK